MVDKGLSGCRLGEEFDDGHSKNILKLDDYRIYGEVTKSNKKYLFMFEEPSTLPDL